MEVKVLPTLLDMLFIFRMLYRVFAGAMPVKLISFLFNPRSASLEGLISSLWSQFNTGILYFICMYSCRVLKDVCVAGLMLLVLLLLPPVGGSFIDFSRSAAHTEWRVLLRWCPWLLFLLLWRRFYAYRICCCLLLLQLLLPLHVY